MGGNALINVKTRRYEKDEYFNIRDEIIGMIKSHSLFAGRKVTDVRAYKNKSSFGDIDILIESDGLPVETWDIVRSIFNPGQLVRNGPVTSLDYKELQVDLILMPSKIFDIAEIYFSYNDLGNLMGRVANGIGFKYGHDGVVYKLRSSDHIIKEITLTTEPAKCFDFLGLSFDRYLNGFDDLNDIFEFVTSSPYFDREEFLLENRNYAARIRDQKRKTYTSFLTWLESRPELPNYDARINREFHLDRAKTLYPSLSNEIADALDKYNKGIAVKSKYNGTLFSEWSGLSGVVLSDAMGWYKAQHSDFNTFLLNTPVEDIAKDVKSRMVSFVPTVREIKYGKDKVREWTGMSGSQLKSFMSFFRQRWPEREAFEAWVANQNETTIRDTVISSVDEFKP